MNSQITRITAAIQSLHKAFGAPGDYGYETAKGKALYELYALHRDLVAAKPAAADASLEDRLANHLAKIIDTPLLTVRDISSNSPVELCLGAFHAELSEQACLLLEEAGR